TLRIANGAIACAGVTNVGSVNTDRAAATANEKDVDERSGSNISVLPKDRPSNPRVLEVGRFERKVGSFPISDFPWNRIEACNSLVQFARRLPAIGLDSVNHPKAEGNRGKHEERQLALRETH